MLWEAGQNRLRNEGRDRLAERYVATRDAWLSAEVLIGRAKVRRGDHVPEYATAPKPKKGLAQLLRETPGAVDRGDTGLVN